MTLNSLLHRLDIERRAIAPFGFSIEQLPHVTRIRSADGSCHVIFHSALSEDTADAAIDAQIEHYRSLQVEVEWKVYGHDKPPDLRKRLESRGFAIGQLETVLVLDLASNVEWVDEPPALPIIRAENPEQVDLFARGASDVFGKDFTFTANELRAAIAAGSTQHLGYVALDGQAPVSVGRLYANTQSIFGGLYGGGTIASHRGRGLYRAMVAARARDARKLGAKWLIVDALPTSRPILERLGFVRLTDTWPCTRRP
ncbi:MAG TPA: hypothetical protein VH370_08985 [Humisphaera sp.]|jgi:hypothetical protein|nr:hypothetical protein [Humisphaera sp.]